MASPTQTSEQIRQTKYDTNIKIAYNRLGEESSMRILRFAQKNQGKGHEHFVFYKESQVRGVMTDIRNSDGSIKNYDSANKTYKKLAANDTTDLTLAVAVKPIERSCPYEMPKDQHNNTQLDEEGIIIRNQKEALANNRLNALLNPIKSLIGTTYTGAVPDTGSGLDFLNGNLEADEMFLIKEHRYGDVTKTFYENEEAFFQMLTELEKAGIGEGNNCSSGLLHGNAFYTAINMYDRASDKDYITTADVERTNKSKYTIKVFSKTEMIPIVGYDDFMGKTNVVGLLSGSLGFDTYGAAEFETDYLKESRTYWYNATEAVGATVVDEYGVYHFQWNGSIGTRIVKTESVTTP